MRLDDYQRATETTVVYAWPDAIDRMTYCMLGLAGEAGEVANTYKKIWRDDGGQISESRRSDLVHELGDVLWYVARLAAELGYSLDQVAGLNLAKLRARQR